MLLFTSYCFVKCIHPPLSVQNRLKAWEVMQLFFDIYPPTEIVETNISNTYCQRWHWRATGSRNHIIYKQTCSMFIVPLVWCLSWLSKVFCPLQQLVNVAFLIPFLNYFSTINLLKLARIIMHYFRLSLLISKCPVRIKSHVRVCLWVIVHIHTHIYICSS